MLDKKEICGIIIIVRRKIVIREYKNIVGLDCMD